MTEPKTQAKSVWRIEEIAGRFVVIDVYDDIAKSCRTIEGARGWIAGWEACYAEASVLIAATTAYFERGAV